MGSTAPDWRVIGSPPATTGAPAQAPASFALSTRSMAWLAAGLGAAVALGAVLAFLAMPATEGVVIDEGAPAPFHASDASSGGGVGLESETGGPADRSSVPHVVDVEGAVARPGLVHVPPGGRVGDAIDLAGGFAADADLAGAAAALNLAQEVSDGLKVVVPAVGDVPAAPGAVTGAAIDGSAGPIDLNRATEAELDTLPGVGPATIAKIVAARDEAPFATVDELRSRGIIGDATFGKLRELVAVGR
jgi:competence protein ComEA